MVIEITPLDTLFFRDGRPFTMGDDTWANGMFPPSPSVFYGALRSVYLAHKKSELNGDLYAQIERIEKITEQFEIRGIYYKLGEESTYLPLPLDCVKEKRKEKVMVLELKQNESFISGTYPFHHILRADTANIVENVEGGMIAKRLFSGYLSARPKTILEIKQLSDLVISEPKIGIGRADMTHATEETRLYRTDSRRLETYMKRRKPTQKLSFILSCSDLENFPTQGMLKLGGEGKAAIFRIISEQSLIDKLCVTQPPISGKYFTICLTTPAFFENGWKPKWIEDQELLQKIFPKAAFPIKFLAATIGKAVAIGGFNMKPMSSGTGRALSRQLPKPMRKAVPAGSVYYFEVLDSQFSGNLADVFTSSQTSISEYDTRKQGFGLYYIGGIQCKQ